MTTAETQTTQSLVSAKIAELESTKKKFNHLPVIRGFDGSVNSVYAEFDADNFCWHIIKIGEPREHEIKRLSRIINPATHKIEVEKADVYLGNFGIDKERLNKLKHGETYYGTLYVMETSPREDWNVSYKGKAISDLEYVYSSGSVLQSALSYKVLLEGQSRWKRVENESDLEYARFRVFFCPDGIISRDESVAPVFDLSAVKSISHYGDVINAYGSSTTSRNSETWYVDSIHCRSHERLVNYLKRSTSILSDEFMRYLIYGKQNTGEFGDFAGYSKWLSLLLNTGSWEAECEDVAYEGLCFDRAVLRESVATEIQESLNELVKSFSGYKYVHNFRAYFLK